MIIHLFLTVFRSHVDLGSGVQIPIPLEHKTVKIMRKPKKTKDVPENKIPKTPDPVTITMVDGVEIKVERLPVRYETLDSLMDELPDFCVAILEKL